MQIAMLFNHLSTWAQHEMEGIAEDNFSTNFLYIPGQHPFDRSIGTHGHKCRSLHCAPGKAQLTTARLAICGRDIKLHKTVARAGLSHDPVIPVQHWGCELKT